MGVGNAPKVNMGKRECKWLAKQIDSFGHFEERDKEFVLVFNNSDLSALEKISVLTGGIIHQHSKSGTTKRVAFGGRAKLYIILTQVLPYLNHRSQEASDIVSWIIDKDIPERKPYSTWIDMYMSGRRLA